VAYLAAATALNYFAYNFIKIHRTLHTSPAMAAGVTDRLWSVESLVALRESYERRAERAASTQMTKLADATPERIADHFVNYLFGEYPGDRHVRRVVSWVGLIVLGIEKLIGHRYVPHSRQLRFDYAGRSFRAKYNHKAGPRGGIDIVEILAGRGPAEGLTICSITNLEEAASFYEDPARVF